MSLTRRVPLRRLTKLAPVNRKRKAKAFRRNFGKRSDAVREMRCLGCVARRKMGPGLNADGTRTTAGGGDLFDIRHELGQQTPTQAAHVKARGMGGVGGSRRDLVPLCAAHHLEAGEARTSARAEFEARHRLSLEYEAKMIAERLDAEGFE